ncbi:hypothetical protein [Cyanothece sp. BG0011]|uniref:hypothetical protein n=1 Tax=Cyanothece sp. BG0011 TaxID=2082950 RepID=UPI000D1E92DA|nr:hypothetical protein [Cyanothece sp. BG0011]
MNNKNSIHPTQKIFVNISLICLGISANATFFSLMVTFLLGTVVLGWLSSQKDKFTLNTENMSNQADKKAMSSSMPPK